MREHFSGKVLRQLSIRSAKLGSDVAAFDFQTSEAGGRIHAGNSGSPVTVDGRVVGVLCHGSSDSRTGIAISSSSIAAHFPNLAESSRSTLAEDDAWPPEPSRLILHKDDLRRGMFADENGVSHSEIAGRRLRLQLCERPSSNVFYFDAIIESVDGSDLVGPARFFLHDTYPRSVIWVRKVDPDQRSITLREISSTGAYTLGAQIRDRTGTWVGLEASVADIGGLPPKFRTR